MMKLHRSIGLAVIASLALSGCFDDDDEEVVETPPVATGEVPASAGASVAAFTAFVMAQAATTSETAEPLGTDLIVQAPTSETEEPVAVN